MDKEEKSRRFMKAFSYLQDNGLIGEQKDFAKTIGMEPASISNIKNGKHSPSDKTLQKLSEKFKGVFNIDFFRGESDVMLAADLERENPLPDFLMQKAFLEERVAMLQERVSDKEETIASMKRELAGKDAHIADLQQQIADLRSILNQAGVRKKMPAGSNTVHREQNTDNPSTHV